MLPLILDVTHLSIFVIGGGAQAQRRLRFLDEAQAQNVLVYCDGEVPEMQALAGQRFQHRLPDDNEIATADLIFVANLDEAHAAHITEIARAHKTLINVEDVKPQCDFHVPAIVRRGDLLLTASTGGQSPALARRLKDFLTQRFPESWSVWTDEIAQARLKWREEGLGFSEVTEKSNALIDEKGWLECHCPLIEKQNK
ncbi:MAG: precorrin-2 dehydrogenase/sirohydrochlorin ferrochelatase family protein [Parvibaculales bacterium]